MLARICYKQVNSIQQATHIRVDVHSEKFKMNDKTSICQIKIHPELKLTIIEFEKIVYYFDAESNKFVKTKINMKEKKLGEFVSSKPHSNTEEMRELKLKFGENVMKIPIPSFFSLYKEHIVAPFFVFQLFCILLWVFDDYGMHSFFTLTMLCIFEATVVSQRIISLVTLRKMRVPPHYIYAYRMNAWQKLSSSELLPGDIVSVLDGGTYEASPEKMTTSQII
jgi:cation-transporting ATPase 13A1